ncbi:unnamed protein product [marine sediment metagenome]|uniref:Uncharacterized protein n=1 Tax=marine sediment metagenome TaxID=412755 RepID=X1LGU6_9ZZZZ
MNKSLIKKSEIIKGVNGDKYLKAILEEYERFYTSRRNDFNYFVEKAEKSLFIELTSVSLRLRDEEKEKEKELLKIFKKYEEKISKKDIEIDKGPDFFFSFSFSLKHKILILQFLQFHI